MPPPPPLTLSQEGVSYEVRRYDAAKYAVVSSEGRTFDQVTGELVRKLLMYIGGSNEEGQPIRELAVQTNALLCLGVKRRCAIIYQRF